MARINIPRSEYGILAELANIPEAAFSELVSGLQELEPMIKQLDFSSLLAQKTKTLKPADLKALLRTLFSLYGIMDARDKSAQEVADDLRETIQREKPDNFPSEKTEIFCGRIQKLLSVGGFVAVAAKAANVMGEQDRIFLSARVLSDIRPVFTNQPDSVSGAVVTHSLNIHYHQEGEHKDFYVGMAAQDLQALKKAIERAEKKSATLKSLVNKLEIRYFEAE